MSIYGTISSPLQEEGCTFHKLLASTMPALDKLIKVWDCDGDDYSPDLMVCGTETTPPEFTKLVLSTGKETSFTGYVCRHHETTVLQALAKHDTGITPVKGATNTVYYPLTQAEVISGKFDLAPDPSLVFTSDDQACNVWQEVTLPGYVINGLGGRTTLDELR